MLYITAHTTVNYLCIFHNHCFFFFSGPRECSPLPKYSLEVSGPFQNAFKLLRAMQLGKPLLLEGVPGVGKTTLVTALARASGHHVVRINLSEQTVSGIFSFVCQE